MAFPTTISTTFGASLGFSGPFLSSGGNVYVITISNTGGDDLRAYKATDPTSSFTAVGTDVSVTSGDAIQGVSIVQSGDNLHVVSVDGSAANKDLRYHVFSMSSDSWTTSNELIKDNATPVTGFVPYPVSISIRSDGDVIVLYNGSSVANMGNDRERVVYARREAGVWTIDVAVDNGGATNWIAGAVVIGSSDRMHFFFVDDGASDAYQRALTSANSLQAFPASYDTVINTGDTVQEQKGISYVSGANTKVRYPCVDGNVNELNSAKCDSADTPTMSEDTDITGATSFAQADNAASFAADGTTLWNTFIQASTSDIFTQSNADDGGWSAPASFYAGTVTKIYTNVYTRGSDTVLAMVFTETDPKYHEKVLSSAGNAASLTAAATLTWTGASTAAVPFSDTAVGALTWNGKTTAASAFSDTAAAVLTWTGAQTLKGNWTAAAVGNLTWAGASTAADAFSSSAAAVVTWNATSTATSAFSDTAAAVLTWNGASTATSNFNQAAVATLTWNGVGITSAALSIPAVAALTWDTKTFISADLSAAGAAVLTWNGAATTASAWSATTAAVLTWNGTGLYSGAWSATAAASVTWEGTDGTAAATEAAISIAAAGSVTWNGTATSTSDWNAIAAGSLTWTGASDVAGRLTQGGATSTLDFQAVIFMNGAWNVATTAAVTWTGTSNASGDWAEIAVGNLTWNGAETAAGAFSDTAAAVLTWDTKAFTSGAWSAAAVGLESWTGAELTQTGSDASFIAAAAANFAGEAVASGAAEIVASAVLTFTGTTTGAKKNLDGWKPRPNRIEEDEEKLLEELKKGALMFFQQGGGHGYH
jgi:hypothetical protein